MLKKSMILGLLAAAAFPLCAANVSFLVIETGLSDETAGQYSTLWENSLLDVFFESGHIVSNAPILRLREKPAEDLPFEAEQDFDNAKEGGMQYFLVAVVDYRTPLNVSLCLFSTKTQELLQKQLHQEKTTRPGREEQEIIKQTIGAIAAQIR